MTKPWRHKINSSNILFVLITFILIEAEWAVGSSRSCRSRTKDFNVKALEVSRYRANTTRNDLKEFIVGNDQISRYYFRSSSSNVSLTLNNVNRCLDNFQLITCLKMLLLDQINVAVDLLREPEIAKTDVVFLDGLVSFNRKENAKDSRWRDSDETETTETSTLDEEISRGIFRLFENRSLRINLASKYRLDVAPIPSSRKDGFVHFGYEFVKKSDPTTEASEGSTGRSSRKRKKGGGMSMMMFVPQMIMLGFLPFTLASLKAMVMNAVMVNMMALNGAIFMTIRNLVFGPRKGDNVQYVNYGYSKNRQTQRKRPVLIIHSPAAFVKQPSSYYKINSYSNPSYLRSKLQETQPHYEYRNDYYHEDPYPQDSYLPEIRNSGATGTFNPNQYPIDNEYNADEHIPEVIDENVVDSKEDHNAGNRIWKVRTKNTYGKVEDDEEEEEEVENIRYGIRRSVFIRPNQKRYSYYR